MPLSMTTLTLTPEELKDLTGVTQKQRQIEDLHAQGFIRARLTHGRVILERAHYEAVCAGRFALAGGERDTKRPTVKQVHSV